MEFREIPREAIGESAASEAVGIVDMLVMPETQETQESPGDKFHVMWIAELEKWN